MFELTVQLLETSSTAVSYEAHCAKAAASPRGCATGTCALPVYWDTVMRSLLRLHASRMSLSLSLSFCTTKRAHTPTARHASSELSQKVWHGEGL